MPYFIEIRNGKHCVIKGTKEKPIEVKKCYDTGEEALRFHRALMVNVEDAGKSIDKSVETTERALVDITGLDDSELDIIRYEVHNKDISQASPEPGYEISPDDTCPECAPAEEVEMEQEKATWDTAYVNNLPDSAFLYVESGDKKDGKTTPLSKRHLPYKDSSGNVDLPHLRNAISRLGQSKTGSAGGWLSEDLRKRLLSKAQGMLKSHGGHPSSDEKKSLTVYKAMDGSWRWFSISSTAVEDREAEIVTEKAYDDAIAYARRTGDYGELDVAHVPGTDIGTCDTMIRLGNQLFEGGTLYDTPLAEKMRTAVDIDPAYWGMSLRFRYNPDLFDGKMYKGDIRIKKRTVLPRDIAASLGTAIAVQGGNVAKSIGERERDALLQMGVSEEEIAELAEKAKTYKEEPNVVEKDDNKKSLIQAITEAVKSVLSPEPDTREPDAEEQETPDETEVKQDVSDDETIKETNVSDAPAQEIELTEDAIKAIAQKAAETVSPAIQSALQETNKALEERFASIAQWQETFASRLTEAEKDKETKVAERLKELPPVVKVRMTEVNPLATPAPETETEKSTSPTSTFMESVKATVEKATGNASQPFKV